LVVSSSRPLSKRFIQEIANRSDKIDNVLAELLGRTGSAILIILGLFTSAVLIFPSFKPVDMIAGLGITSVVIGFAFKTFCKTGLPVF